MPLIAVCGHLYCSGCMLPGLSPTAPLLELCRPEIIVMLFLALSDIEDLNFAIQF